MIDPLYVASGIGVGLHVGMTGSPMTPSPVAPFLPMLLAQTRCEILMRWRVPAFSVTLKLFVPPSKTGVWPRTLFAWSLTTTAAYLPPVLGDRIQLQQVVLNLLTYAIEAMRDVTGRRRGLLVSARRHSLGPDAGVLVAVEDAGAGFEPASVDQLFQALYTTKPDGLGMGLSISRSIVLSHGGRLWATPNAGYGATFQFVVPAGKGQGHEPR